MNDKDIESRYIKLTHKEHVLHRSETYIGSIITEEKEIFIVEDIKDFNKIKISKQIVNYNPGFFKIFDEILNNSSDHAIRTNEVKYIKVNIFDDHIIIENDGPGIPVEIHKKEKIYIPELIFGHLLTSENYDDTEERIIGGRHGYGAKLTNIFSKIFDIETSDGKKVYYQRFLNNLSKINKPKIKPSKKNYTKVTFYPDFEKFNITGIDDEIQSILLKRVIDISAYNPKIKVYYNDNLIPIKHFKDYINMFLDENDYIYEKINDYWEIALSSSFEDNFIQNSMVNGISTINGGTHVNYISNQLCNIIKDNIIKGNKNINIKQSDIKNNLFLFLNCKIVNPTFENQTKETLTTKITSNELRDFKFTDNFIRKLLKSSIVENITNRVLLKNQHQLQKDIDKVKKTLKIKKLDDAIMAGTKESIKNNLFLTEGDSAMSTALSGFAVTGRKYFGVYPLKGKPINVRGEGITKIKDNEEIKNIISALGLEFGKKYKDLSTLRYGKLVIMSDSDVDGSHIKGLIINLFDNFWPELLDLNFIYEFITPIVKIEKDKRHRYFYSLTEYKKWKLENDTKGWYIKYYKGLGTILPQEAKLFFKNIDKHLIRFNTNNREDRTNLIDLAFNKKRTNDRKEWLVSYKPGIEIDKFVTKQTYESFINNELIEFSMSDNIRSIPNIMDGLKPSQRKILYTFFKKNIKEQVKVSAFSGDVISLSAYHHGQASLEGSIINMAQDFVGSNNINLLEPKGQFGTRLKGGKDSSASRYIFTKLNSVSRYIFKKDDDNILTYLNDDGYLIEPIFYIPIIPMILVNGSEGIGTGWSSEVPKYNPIDIIDYLLNKINNKKNKKLVPYYKNFKGKIYYDDKNDRFVTQGVFEKINSTAINIKELPIGMWNDKYYDFLDNLIDNKLIKDYIKNSTDVDVNIDIDISRENMSLLLNNDDVYKKLNLETYLNISNMYLVNENYKIIKFDSPEEIIDYYYKIRLDYYNKRKEYIINKIEEEITVLINKMKFIKNIITDRIKVYKQSKLNIERQLIDLKFKLIDESYDYLLNMPIYSLTKEKIIDLKSSYDSKKVELENIKKSTLENLWLDDLKELKQFLVKNIGKYDE